MGDTTQICTRPKKISVWAMKEVAINADQSKPTQRFTQIFSQL